MTGPVRHSYVGPKGTSYIRTLATRWHAVCVCGWEGPSRVTRQQARSDHRMHVDHAAADVREATEIDRHAGWEADVD